MNKCASCPFRAERSTCLGSGRCAGERSIASPPPRRLDPSAPLRVGLAGACCRLGGAESVDALLASSTDPSKIQWVRAAAQEDRSRSDPAALARLEALMPVDHGPGSPARLAGDVDLVISWAVFDHARAWSGQPSRPRIVQLAHFPAESPVSPGSIDLLSTVDRWVAVSELAVASMPPRLRPGVEVIWNAVDPARLVARRTRTEVRASWGIDPSEDAPVAVYLGRLSPEKDPLAMARLARALPSKWRVVVVGDGPERATLAGEASTLPNLHVVGPDPDVGGVLDAADVLVVPSRYESFGLTLAEGLMKRLPVVSTASGLAKIHPGLTRTIPFGGEGPILAREVIAAKREGPRPGFDCLLARLDPSRFAREWTDLIRRVVDGPESPRPTVAESRAAMAKVKACPHRTPPACGCSQVPATCARADKAGPSWLPDCMACVQG